MRFAVLACVLFSTSCQPAGTSLDWPAEMPEVSFLFSTESGLLRNATGPYLDRPPATLSLPKTEQLVVVGWDRTGLQDADAHIDLERLSEAQFETNTACSVGEIRGSGADRTVTLPFAPSAQALFRIGDQWMSGDPPEGSVTFARTGEACGYSDRPLTPFIPVPLDRVGITIEGEDPGPLFDVREIVPITDDVVLARLQFGLVRVERDADWTNNPDDLLTARQLINRPRRMIVVEGLDLLSRTSTSVDVFATLKAENNQGLLRNGFVVHIRWPFSGPPVVVDRLSLPDRPSTGVAINRAGQALIGSARESVRELWALRAWDAPIEATPFSGGTVELIEAAPSLGDRAFWFSAGSLVYSAVLGETGLEIEETSIRVSPGRVVESLYDDGERLLVGTDGGLVLDFNPSRGDTREVEIWLGPGATCPGSLQNKMLCSRPLNSRSVRGFQSHKDRLLVAVNDCSVLIEHPLGRRCDAAALETRAGSTEPLSLTTSGGTTIVGARRGEIFLLE